MPTQPDGPSVDQAVDQAVDRAVDGRTARGRRNRTAIVESFLALVAEGETAATGHMVAERAGVAARTFWTHFTDLEALYDAAARELFRRYRERHVPVAADLPLPERVAAFCAQRARENESIAPFARAAALREPASPSLRDSRARFFGHVGSEVERVFADLAPTGEPSLTHRALVSAVTFPTWATLRDDLGLAPDRAESAVRLTVAALLGVDPTAAEAAARVRRAQAT